MTYDLDAESCTCGHLRRSHGSYTTEGWSGSVGGGQCGYCGCARMAPGDFAWPAAASGVTGPFVSQNARIEVVAKEVAQ